MKSSSVFSAAQGGDRILLASGSYGRFSGGSKVSCPRARGAMRVLVSGSDFYAFPAPSPDGTRLAWICWDPPRMPWDGTELRVAALDGTEHLLELLRLPHAPHQPSEHLTRLHSAGVESREARRRNQTEIVGKQQVVLEFGG